MANLKKAATSWSALFWRTSWSVTKLGSTLRFFSRASIPLLRSSSHFSVGLRRVSQRFATPPPSTRDTRSSNWLNRSTRTWSEKSSSLSQSSSFVLTPSHANSSSRLNSSRSSAMRAHLHASTMRCSSRPICVYLSSTYSRSVPWNFLISVRNAITVCIPFTKVNLRFDRYSASFCDLGKATTEAQKGTRVSSPGSSTTIDPRHGSASTSTLPGLMVLPVHTRSTMQSTTCTLPASLSLSLATMAWSFSQQNSTGSWSAEGASGSWLSRGARTANMALPKLQLSVVARSTIGPSSSHPLPNTRDTGGMTAGRLSEDSVPGESSFTPRVTGTPSTLKSMRPSGSLDLANTSCHLGLGLCTTAKGIPDAEMAGTTRPIPSRPAPKCTWKRLLGWWLW
mmetsp:Transcript_7421/g.13935  ORF Transcript_7421/g.13935 Transcript_7421/m.13935 type:complete len:395 (+) Transcript_7421:976-2160(+)